MAVDWVGRVESVEEDLAALVELLNQRPGVPKLQPLRPGQLGHVNVNSGSCQPSDAGSSSIGTLAGRWLGRRRLAAPPAADDPPRATPAPPSAGPAAAAQPLPGQGQNSSATRMKLPPEEWEPRGGTINLCDKNDMLRGRFSHCLDALKDFYAEDMRLLHGR